MGRNLPPARKRRKLNISDDGRTSPLNTTEEENQDDVSPRRNLRPRSSVIHYYDGVQKPPVYPFLSIYEQLANSEEYRNGGTVLEMGAKDFTLQHAHRTGLNRPLIITEQLEELNMKIPTFTRKELKQKLPNKLRINVYDNSTEEETFMSFSNFLQELGKSEDKRCGPLNMSLKITNLKLSTFVQAPSVVRQVDLWRTVFPSQKFYTRNLESAEKYLFMPMAGSLANFHTEDSGAAAWLHVQRGYQYFFLIAPSDDNLLKFDNWQMEEDRPGFFGAQVDQCTAVKVSAGQTLIIPAGWIHAIYSPVDCIVYGGSFLHEHSLGIQMKIYEKDLEMKVHEDCIYPFYQPILWYYMANFVQKACGRDYVRLIKEGELRKILQSEPDPNKCYNIQITPPEYYDKIRGDPIQNTFDPIDSSLNDEPENYNDDFLRQIPTDMRINLAHMASVFTKIITEPKIMKVAEGIRRPLHLFKDFTSQLAQSPQRSEQESSPPIKNDSMRQMILKFHEKGHYDCVIRASGQEFKCLKLLLMMQSGRFEEELTLSGPVSTVEFGDTSAEAAQFFIEWIYNEWDMKFSKTVDELYKLAVEWKVEKLKSDCIEQIKLTLNDDNFCTRLIMAFEAADEEFQKVVIAYGRQMVNVSRFLLKSAQWINFTVSNKERSDLILDRLDL